VRVGVCMYVRERKGNECLRLCVCEFLFLRNLNFNLYFKFSLNRSFSSPIHTLV